MAAGIKRRISAKHSPVLQRERVGKGDQNKVFQLVSKKLFCSSRYSFRQGFTAGVQPDALRINANLFQTDLCRTR